MLWTVTLALTLMVLGIGVALYCFHDAGAISDETFLAVMIFVVAGSAGIVVAMDRAREVRRDTPGRTGKTPPLFDIHIIWPPDDGGAQRDSGDKHRGVRPKIGGGSTKDGI